jgi:deoxyribodipyrimidine photo-lyase
VIVVWFKRDLRVQDHQPLLLASKHGAVLPLYIVEPSLISSQDASLRHYLFVRRALTELRQRLAELGQPLVVRVGEAVDVFDRLHAEHPIEAVYAHMETGSLRSYERDQEVRAWAARRRIHLVEFPYSGVVRRLPNRDEWNDLRTARMLQPPLRAPTALRPVGVTPGPIPTPQELGLEDDGLRDIQLGGERTAHATLHSFLTVRGRTYHYGMSSPITAFQVCSRLSPHLAWGTLTVRQAYHALRQRQRQATPDSAWARALSAFESRLFWRDHFIQKLEDAPDLERRSLVPAYDGLRPSIQQDDEARRRFAAWRDGRTGYPMVDACMRALRATGYLNFRMRAMVVSFASHDLWLDWRETGLVLARWFTDFEPGIHWSQMQMQSGTNGNRTLRIYNPTTQAQQHDPQGKFIRHWLPELRAVPNAFIHAPWLMPVELQQTVGVRIGVDYPAPIVDHDERWREARAVIAEMRQRADVREQSAQALKKHGSRRRSTEWTRRTKRPQRQQASLFGEIDTADAPE